MSSLKQHVGTNAYLQNFVQKLSYMIVMPCIKTAGINKMSGNTFTTDNYYLPWVWHCVRQYLHNWHLLSPLSMALCQTIFSQQTIILSPLSMALCQTIPSQLTFIISLEHGTVSDNTFTTDNYYLPWVWHCVRQYLHNRQLYYLPWVWHCIRQYLHNR